MTLAEAKKAAYATAHHAADFTERFVSSPEPDLSADEAKQLVRITQRLCAAALEIEARTLRVPEARNG